ncbi:hypothetical protein OIO90_000659 [Microbotryomycetes sp. JL221]|nr:hypothetical protein OIO90_000659 [Microbotryomycetes sp. JL221]
MATAFEQRTFISSFDANFDPSILSTSPILPSLSTNQMATTTTSTSSNSIQANSKCSRDEIVPHDGPGTAVYVRQPTRQQLKSNNGLLSNPNRPYYIKDPLGKPFLDLDGKECGPRWILIDPKGDKSSINLNTTISTPLEPTLNQIGSESDSIETPKTITTTTTTMTMTKPILIVEPNGAVRGDVVTTPLATHSVSPGKTRKGGSSGGSEGCTVM